MLLRTLPSCPPIARGTAPLAIQRFAPVALTLPAIPAAIPSSVTFKTADDGLENFALWLVNAGALRVENWTGNLISSCERAMQQFTNKARPRPLVWAKIVFTDDVHSNLGDSNDWSCDSYKDKYHLRTKPEKVGAFTIHIDIQDRLAHLNIGPTLRALEKKHPGLGQTILNTLDRGLNHSCRGVTPRSGYYWAQYIYWSGETDESMRVEEELEENIAHWEYEKKQGNDVGPKPTAADIEGFKRKDYDTAIPGWAGTGRIHPWKLKKLGRFCQRTARSHQNQIVQATYALAERVRRERRMSELSDLGCFEMGCWEVVPFLLRWDGFNDPLGGIFDDVLNNEYESGERQMDVNAAFAFHDGPSLKRALGLLRNYLEVMQLCEDLIRILGTVIKRN